MGGLRYIITHYISLSPEKLAKHFCRSAQDIESQIYPAHYHCTGAMISFLISLECARAESGATTALAADASFTCLISAKVDGSGVTDVSAAFTVTRGSS